MHYQTLESYTILYLYLFPLFLAFSCVIRGCVPKKILVYGATYGGELEV